MMKNKYDLLLEQFEMYYPNLYSQSVDWWASSRRSIGVKLRDGTLIEYDPSDNTIRRVRIDEYEDDENIIKTEFGSNLQKMLSLSGVAKSELASKLGTTNAMISRYIHGASMPSIDKVYKMSRILGCRIDDLFDSTFIE